MDWIEFRITGIASTVYLTIVNGGYHCPGRERKVQIYRDWVLLPVGRTLSFLILYTTIEGGKLSYCVLFTVVYKL